MKHITPLSLAALLLCTGLPACNRSKPDGEMAVEPRIGMGLLAEAVATPDALINCGPADLSPVYMGTYKGMEYQLAIDESGKVKYIQPTGESFATPEGVRAGDTLAMVLGKTSDRPVKVSGWAFVVRLPSGWCVSFVQGKSATEGELADDARANFVFKSESWP